MNDLWILAGQSNMEGCGRLDSLEEPSEHVRLFAHGDAWKTAEEPLHWLLEANDTVHHWEGVSGDALIQAREDQRRDRTNGAGLGLPFAKAVHAATGVAIDLLPAAHGGTSMQQWNPGMKDLGGRSLYGAMLRRTRLALETGGETRLRGVLWYQGESDANPEDATQYLDRMKFLIQSIREDFAAPDLPFYFVQLGPFANPDIIDPAGSESWNTVREMQRVLPSMVHNTAVVPAIDLDLDDAIHIGTEGLKRLGNRLANVALRHVYGLGTPDGITFGGVTRETPTLLRVSYGGVSTGLRAPDFSGRVPGYAIGLEDRVDPNVIFKAMIDPMRPSDVFVYLREEIPVGSALWYGRGFNPFCQLTDAMDMAVPAMGPVAF